MMRKDGTIQMMKTTALNVVAIKLFIAFFKLISG